MKRKVLSLLFAILVMTLTHQTIFAAELLGSGTCGPKATWTLTSDGVLTVSGEGAMYDYNLDQRPGWEKSYDLTGKNHDNLTYEDLSNVFYYDVIKKIVVEEDITTIGARAFNVDFPDSLMFCSEVILPSSIEAIGDEAFISLVDMERLSLAENSSLKRIGRAAFANCKELEALKLPEGLEEIGAYCFFDCEKLSDLYIPKSVKKIGTGAFSETPWLEEQVEDRQMVVINGTLVAVNNEKCTGTIVIPDGTKVIEENSFEFCGEMVALSLPDGLEYIGDYAFYGCENLGEVSIPDSVNFIGQYAFAGCRKISNVELPSNISSLEEGTFFGCDSMKKIIIPDGVQRIERGAFAEAFNLEEIVIPNSVIYIGSAAFFGTRWIENLFLYGTAAYDDYILDTKNLTGEVRIADGTRIISGYSFANSYVFSYDEWPHGVAIEIEPNENLTQIDFPSSLEIIDAAAFSDCKSIEKIIIPEGVREIGYKAFASCSNLKSINIPESVERVGKKVFSDTPIEESKNGKPFVIDNVLFDGKFWEGSEDVLLPEGIRVIADGAFDNVSDIKTLRLPEGVEHIGDFAFSYIDELETVYLPSTLKTIGKNAFFGTMWGRLKTVYFAGTEKEWQNLGGYDLDFGGNVNVKILFNEENYQEIKTFISRLYQNFLGREPDVNGLKNWTDLLVTKQTTGSKVIYGFVYSPEFQNNPLSDDDFITAMYNTILGRNPDYAGLRSWLDVLRNGCTRKKVLAGFLNSDEMEELCDSLGILAGSYKSDEIVDQNTKVTYFVSRMYRHCLGREADASGLVSWVSALVDGRATGAKIATGFFSSPEMKQMNLTNYDFVVNAYVTLLDRQPDEKGLSAWVRALDSGGDRSKIVRGFVKSEEFGNLCAEYGIAR